MKRPNRKRESLVRWLSCGLLALSACAASEEPASEPVDAGPAARKRRLLLGTEMAIQAVIEDARRDSVALQREFQGKVEEAPRTYRLSSSDPVLQTYGDAERKARRTSIEQLRVEAEERVKLLLEHYENAIWTVATRAGELEHGNDLGTRTGYEELDDKVGAALQQLIRMADPSQIGQRATLRIYEEVVMERMLREQVEGIGLLSLFKSPPTLALFAPGQEGVAVVIAFQRDGIAPEVPLSFFQAARRRVERGGIVLSSTPWQTDPATPGGSGVVPLREDLDDANRIATEVCIPAVDTQLESFQALRDRVLITEYRTALRRDDTGEFLQTIGWQVRWNVDFKGAMRVLVEKRDIIVEGDTVLPSLVAAAPKN